MTDSSTLASAEEPSRPRRRAITGRRVRIALSFCGVGMIAYAVDLTVLALADDWLGPYGGRALSYLAAMTAAFCLHRRFVFRMSGPDGLWRQYGLYMAANAIGGAANFAIYAALTAYGPHNPALAVAAGSLIGWAISCLMSHRVVFRA